MNSKTIYLKEIDSGKGFDWGNTSKDYARFRDIYSEAFPIKHYGSAAWLKKK